MQEKKETVLILEKENDEFYAYYTPKESVEKFKKEYLEKGFREISKNQLDNQCFLNGYSGKIFHIHNDYNK